MRYKDRHTIMLPTNPPKTKEDLFNVIFWRNLDLAKPALNIFEAIKRSEDGLSASSWKILCEKNNIKTMQYYHIIYALEGSGMIKHEGRILKVAGTFLSKLEGMINVFEEISGIQTVFKR